MSDWKDERVDDDELIALYRVALTIREADARMQQEVRAGNIKGATYPVRGLEGSCAGLGLALGARDYVVSTYRNLGDAIAKGVPLTGIIAEISGRVDGVSRGRGGAMHIEDVSVGFMTTTGVVGSGLPIANGLALASQRAGDGRVTAVTFGDGATSIGAFHEALNLATLWRLPILFFCQNNGWGEHTPVSEYMANTDITGKVAKYGLAAERVDGFDAIATYRAVQRAVAAIRLGEGPQFIEAVTYRLSGHTSTTDYSYMSKDLLRSLESEDSLARLSPDIAERGLTPAAAAIEAAVRQDVENAFSFAAASEWPRPEEALLDVFADARQGVHRG
jgi:acetoin:2,6-dichlorophenolindophenol oxidoreductase subunit alpha